MTYGKLTSKGESYKDVTTGRTGQFFSVVSGQGSTSRISKFVDAIFSSNVLSEAEVGYDIVEVIANV